MAKVTRTCRYEHGRLELLTGWFALQGVQPYGGGLLNQSKEFRLTGQVAALHVWRCPVCGYVELVDDEAT
jgi:hypothetical protein